MTCIAELDNDSEVVLFLVFFCFLFFFRLVYFLASCEGHSRLCASWCSVDQIGLCSGFRICVDEYPTGSWCRVWKEKAFRRTIWLDHLFFLLFLVIVSILVLFATSWSQTNIRSKPWCRYDGVVTVWNGPGISFSEGILLLLLLLLLLPLLRPSTTTDNANLHFNYD